MLATEMSSDHDVRREQDEAGHFAAAAAGVDEGDGSAVAVAEQDGPPDPERVQDLGKDDQRLVVHEAHAAADR